MAESTGRLSGQASSRVRWVALITFVFVGAAILAAQTVLFWDAAWWPVGDYLSFALAALIVGQSMVFWMTRERTAPPRSRTP